MEVILRNCQPANARTAQCSYVLRKLEFLSRISGISDCHFPRWHVY
jgi:hypothetical protein